MTTSPIHLPRARRHLSVVPPTDLFSIRLDGELDVARVEDIRAQVRRALAAGHLVLSLDLSRVTFMDCTTVGALISCLREARSAGGRLEIAAASTAARRVLELTRTGAALGLPPAA